jgi:hypothetical protein
MVRRWLRIRRCLRANLGFIAVDGARVIHAVCTQANPGLKDHDDENEEGSD